MSHDEPSLMSKTVIGFKTVNDFFCKVQLHHKYFLSFQQYTFFGIFATNCILLPLFSELWYHRQSSKSRLYIVLRSVHRTYFYICLHWIIRRCDWGIPWDKRCSTFCMLQKWRGGWAQVASIEMVVDRTS